jgi:hypothetical protein
MVGRNMVFPKQNSLACGIANVNTHKIIHIHPALFEEGDLFQAEITSLY